MNSALKHRPAPAVLATLLVAGLLFVPAAAFLIALALSNLVREPAVTIINAARVGLFGGGPISFLTTPALVIFTWVRRSNVTPRVRDALYAMCALALVPIAFALLYVFGLENLQ